MEPKLILSERSKAGAYRVWEWKVLKDTESKQFIVQLDDDNGEYAHSYELNIPFEKLEHDWNTSEMIKYLDNLGFVITLDGKEVN